MAIQQTQVIDVLKTTFVPGLKKMLLSVGMLREVKVLVDKVYIAITIPKISDVNVEKLKEVITNRLKQIGAVEVEIEIDFKKEQKIKYMIAVASGKGGVGKSTVSVNLAVSLAKLGKKVGILDADVHGPNVPIMFGITERPRVNNEKRLIPVKKYGVEVISLGFLLEDQSMPIIWRGPLVTKAIEQLYNDVEWGELDYMLIDLPPGTGDAALTVTQTLPLKYGLIVTTPQNVAIADASKSLRMFKEMKIPVLGVVENMSYFICPECGAKSEIFGHGGGEKISFENGVPFLGKVPLEMKVREGGDKGTPAAAMDEDTETKKAFLTIAKKVVEIAEK